MSNYCTPVVGKSQIKKTTTTTYDSFRRVTAYSSNNLENGYKAAAMKRVLRGYSKGNLDA